MIVQDDEDEREEELSSIAAIFPELKIDSTNRFSATLDLPVSPATPIAVASPSSVDGAPPSLNPKGATAFSRDVHYLSHLPPLRLRVTLPDGYPAEKPPIIDLKTIPQYLPEGVIESLLVEAQGIWEEYGHTQTVFAYIDFLQQSADRGFCLTDETSGVFEVPQGLRIELFDHDLRTKRKKFEQETFDCGICLEPKKGATCYRLQRCGHVFCVSCLQDFFNNCIREGDVANVRCMEPSCGKERADQTNAHIRKDKAQTLSPSELLQIPLERSKVLRFVELKRKKKLESDKSTIYCPRKWCQGPARSKKYPKSTDPLAAGNEDSDDEETDQPASDAKPDYASMDRLAICEDCTFAFCRVCLASWHGDYVRCWPRSESELTTEEKASYDYIRMHTSPCPTCSSPCQKTHGCNHMNCFQCRTHFCYLCSSWLDPQNPYQHFNRKELGCYMRLWELEEGDEGNGDVRFEGARGWEAAIAAANEADQEEVMHEQAPAPAQARQADVVDVGLEAGMQNLAMEEAPAPRFQMPPRRQHGRQQAPVPPDQGLQRFLAMVQNDEEDDWDSDEMGDDDEFLIPVR